MAIFAEILGPSCKHCGSNFVGYIPLTCLVFSQSKVAEVATDDSIGECSFLPCLYHNFFLA